MDMLGKINFAGADMRIVVLSDYDSISDYACDRLQHKLQTTTKSPFVLGLPTGSTPVGMYSRMAESRIDFSKIVTFNMDEYVGLSHDDKNSYHSFMNENLFKKVNIPSENINILDGMTLDIEKECSEYENKIMNLGGIDLFFGGVGANGHIAFNEPGTSFSSHTRKVSLTEKTITDNARFFASADDVPRYALTVGIVTIMSAKELVFLASGKNKAEAVKNAVHGEISESCPVSILRKHPSATLVVDKDAASLLES